MKKIIPLEERFWSKVRMPSDPYDCWEWTAALLETGYGVIGLGGRKDGVETAHRLSYLFAHEFISEGMEVCHTCNNRRCVNPMHLYEGTRSDNMRQAFRQGRSKVPNRWKPGTFHVKKSFHELHKRLKALV